MSQDEPGFALNPDLDRKALAEAFARTGRLHIPGVLSPETAETIGQALRSEPDWIRTVRVKDGFFNAPLDGTQPRESQAADWLAQARIDGMDGAMQYIFDVRRLSSEKRYGLGKPDRLAEAEAWLNGAEVLDFIRQVTGAETVVACDAQASRFLPGHALTAHNDRDGARARQVAFVLNFARPWRPDWGGLLLFYSDQGHVVEGFTPGWNTLNLFRVPMSHAVSTVAPFAEGERLAISGWFTAPAATEPDQTP